MTSPTLAVVRAHQLRMTGARRETLERLLGVEPQFSHFPIVGLCRGCRKADTADRLQEGRGHAHS